MKTTSLAKTRTRTEVHAGEKSTISQRALVAMAVPSALVGLWAAACLVSAMVSNGGPLGLVRIWFQAITGI